MQGNYKLLEYKVGSEENVKDSVIINRMSCFSKYLTNLLGYTAERGNWRHLSDIQTGTLCRLNPKTNTMTVSIKEGTDFQEIINRYYKRERAEWSYEVPEDEKFVLFNEETINSKSLDLLTGIEDLNIAERSASVGAVLVTKEHTWISPEAISEILNS